MIFTAEGLMLVPGGGGAHHDAGSAVATVAFYVLVAERAMAPKQPGHAYEEQNNDWMASNQMSA